MTVEAKLAELGIELPSTPRALANYAPAVRTGNLLFIAGQGPMVDGTPTVTGKVGASVTPEDAYAAARQACLNALAVARDVLGSLSKVTRAVNARVYVACTDGFTEQPRVANGATDLLRELWGAEALPARAAVGVNVLPMDIPVEVELVLEVR